MDISDQIFYSDFHLNPLTSMQEKGESSYFLPHIMSLEKVCGNSENMLQKVIFCVLCATEQMCGQFEAVSLNVLREFLIN